MRYAQGGYYGQNNFSPQINVNVSIDYNKMMTEHYRNQDNQIINPSDFVIKNKSKDIEDNR